MDIAEPPGGGRLDHDTMQAAAVRPVAPGGSTDTLAAIGGLDLPAHEAHPELAPAPKGFRREPIPGEREATTPPERVRS